MDQFVGGLALLGGNFLTEGDRREFSSLLANQQEVIANLDTQMAIAQDTLNKLIQQRNEVHRAILSSTSPSAATQKTIQDIIIEKEALLHQALEEIADTQIELEMLLGMIRSDVTSQSSHLDSHIIHHDQHSTHGEFDARLHWCRSHLEHLIQERNDAQNILETHFALLSPIRRLPLELLGVIFTFCVPHDGFIQPSSTEAPLLLLNVCSTWRNIALATSTLWSSMWIKVQGQRYSPQLTLVKTWIERSGSQPLSFRVEESERVSQAERAISPLSAVLDIFIPHLTRWRRVHLEYKDSFSMQSGLSFISADGTFPLLESLYLERGYWIEPQDMDRIANMLAAPFLRSVSWISQKPYTSAPFPWAQLIQFTLSHIIQMKEAIWILSECPLLKSAEFTLLLPSGPQAAATPESDSATGAIEHRCLQSLSLHMAGNLGVLFDNVTLPRLKQLSLRALQGMFPVPPPPQFGISWPQDEFISFLHRSGCSLESLSLTEIEISPLRLLDCLRYVSVSLSDLHLSNELLRQTYVDDNILQSLTLSSVTEDGNGRLLEPLCPNLKSLKLWGCISCSDGVLAQMLTLRWRSRGDKSPVQQLDMAMVALHDEPLHIEDLAQIRSLNEKRIGITLITL